MSGFLLRYVLYAALGFGLTALPFYQDILAPAACRGLALLSGWLALRPDAVAGVLLQAAPAAYTVEVMPECLGAEALINFLAAVLAFPASPRARAVGVAAGLGLILAVNPLRIASLYRLGLVAPEWAGWVHDNAWDPMFFCAEIGVFLSWVVWARRAIPVPQLGRVGTASSYTRGLS